MDPLNRDELKVMLDTFNKHFNKHYPMALTLARTGMRLGEVTGLQWGDIDFRNRFITIQRGLVRGKIEAPKNSKTRKIDMINFVLTQRKRLRCAFKISCFRDEIHLRRIIKSLKKLFG